MEFPSPASAFVTAAEVPPRSKTWRNTNGAFAGKGIINEGEADRKVLCTQIPRHDGDGKTRAESMAHTTRNTESAHNKLSIGDKPEDNTGFTWPLKPGLEIYADIHHV